MWKNKDTKTKPVDETNWADFETLFQSKGGPSYCWCMAWRMTKEELKHNNSISRKEFIKQRVFSDTPIGLLAYEGDDAFAWCSVAPRETFQRLGGDGNLKNIWLISCFYIKREFRKKVLIGFFIENAKKYAKENGAEYIEAYPVDIDSPSYRHMGYIKTFEKAGFNFVKMAGTRRYVMTFKL